MENQTIIHKNERANSYEFGKASNRFKIYFDTAVELDEAIKALRLLGYAEEEEETK